MSLLSVLLSLLVFLATAEAFHVVVVTTGTTRTPFGPQARPATAATAKTTTTALSMGIEMASDFASAVSSDGEGGAAKMTLEERIQKCGDDFARQVRSNLGTGVEAPPELEALEAEVEREGTSTNVKLLSKLMYELMIECGMLYDKDPETGVMTPTGYDIKSNLETPEVKKEFNHLYMYGINLISTDLISQDDVKSIVEQRLISRTGLTPQEFDKWLGF